MDAASRPSLELLPDLPVEEPLDAALAPPIVAPAAPMAAGARKDPEQTDLHFIDPELFMSPEQAAALAPPPLAPVASPEPPSGLELALEDPVIDEMLTAPPPRPPAPPTLAAAPSTPPDTKSAAFKSSESEASRSAARVPIARTAALSSAATKLAAASAAQQRPVKASVITAPPVMPAARAPAGAAPKAAAPAATPNPRAETPKAEASKSAAAGLAGWASARSAATPATTAKGAPAKASAPAPATPAKFPAAKSAAPAPTPPAQTATAASPPMDRDFIARNQVVERYLSGRLPLKGATDFERFCHAHPDILDEIGLPERVNAGLRLLEASGKPEPWQEAARPMWQRPQVTLGLAAAVAVFGIALAVVGGGSAAKNHRIAALQKQAFERALDPATSTREIRLLPSREGASNAPAITIGGSSVQMADFKIDESRSPYHAFRVTIDRIDQGRVGVITNLTKDSNGHLRIALNSSALGPGAYQLTIEGLNWRGEAEPDSWITIGVLR